MRIESATYGARVDHDLAHRLQLCFEPALRDTLERGGVAVVNPDGMADYSLEVRIVDAKFATRRTLGEFGDPAIESRLEMRGVAMLASLADPDNIVVRPIPISGRQDDYSFMYESSGGSSPMSQERLDELMEVHASVIAAGIVYELGLVTNERIKVGVR